MSRAASCSTVYSHQGNSLPPIRLLRGHSLPSPIEPDGFAVLRYQNGQDITPKTPLLAIDPISSSASTVHTFFGRKELSNTLPRPYGNMEILTRDTRARILYFSPASEQEYTAETRPLTSSWRSTPPIPPSQCAVGVQSQGPPGDPYVTAATKAEDSSVFYRSVMNSKQSSTSDPIQVMKIDTSEGSCEVRVEVSAGSKAADEKRKRNAKASSRSRQRKKEVIIQQLKQERDFYRNERDRLRHVVSNTPGLEHHV